MSIRLLHGVHVPHRKNTAACAPTRMPAPAVVTIPMSMNIGKPAVPVVKVNDTVKVGQMIAEAGGFVSAPIYSGVSGKVTKIEERPHSGRGACQAIVIQPDGADEWAEGLPVSRNWEAMEKEDILTAIQQAGIVGMGGATFPEWRRVRALPYG